MRRVRFGISLNEDHPQGLAVKKFAEAAAARSKDRIQVELFASGRLGSDVLMCDKLRQGQLDMAATDTSTLVRFRYPPRVTVTATSSMVTRSSRRISPVSSMIWVRRSSP